MLYDHTALDGNDDLDGWYSILRLTTRLNPHGMCFMNHMPMYDDAGGDDCDSEDGSITEPSIKWPDFKYGTFFYHQPNQHNMINSKWWQSCFAINKWIRLDSGQAFHLPGWSKHCAWLETSWSRQQNLWDEKKKPWQICGCQSDWVPSWERIHIPSQPPLLESMIFRTSRLVGYVSFLDG